MRMACNWSTLPSQCHLYHLCSAPSCLLSGFNIPQGIPSHSWLKRGVAPPANRYNIKPGRHWDGVVRGTEFEQQVRVSQICFFPLCLCPCRGYSWAHIAHLLLYQQNHHPCIEVPKPKSHGPCSWLQPAWLASARRVKAGARAASLAASPKFLIILLSSLRPSSSGPSSRTRAASMLATPAQHQRRSDAPGCMEAADPHPWRP